MALEAGVVPHYWWAFALRGLAAVVFGILAFVWPSVTLAVLVLLFGAFALVNGALAIVSAFRSRGDHLWLFVAEGVVGIIVGLGVLSWPELTALLLLYVIAAWAIVIGVLEVISGYRVRHVVEHEWAWILSGILSVLFGVILIARPEAGALAVIWLIGAFAVLFGISLLILAWHLREMERAEHGHAGGTSAQQPVVS